MGSSKSGLRESQRLAGNFSIAERWDELPDAANLTVAEVASYLRVARGHIYNAIHSRHLAASQLSGTGRGIYRIQKRAVTRWLEDSRVETSPRLPNPAQKPPQQDKSRPFKHLKASWLHAQPPEEDGGLLKDARSAQSSASLNGPSTQRSPSGRSRS